MKRPPPPHPMQPGQQQRMGDPANKQRRMDLLLPDRNEDADCHVIAQQKRNDGLPVIQNVQGATVQQSGRNDSTIHLSNSITLSVRQPGKSHLNVFRHSLHQLVKEIRRCIHCKKFMYKNYTDIRYMHWAKWRRGRHSLETNIWKISLHYVISVANT